MNHQRQQPQYHPVGDDLGDSVRATKRRSPTLPEHQQHPSLGQYTYPHQQASTQHLYAPQMNELDRASFDFRFPNGSNQAPPALDARSNILMQTNSQNQTGNASHPSYNDGNSFYPVDTSGAMHSWAGEQPLQPLFDWDAPVIGHTQFGNQYNDRHRAANEANWSALGSPASSESINPAPSQPKYGTPAPSLSRNSYHQPTNNGLARVFTAELIKAANRRTLPTQTNYSKNLLHTSAVSPGTRQDTVKTNSRPCSDGVTTPISLVPSNTGPSRREVSDTSPAWNSRTEAFQTTPARLVALGPIVDGVIKKGDNCPPKKRKRHFLQNSLVPLTTSSGARAKFLDPRPDPLDTTKIPCSTLSTGLLVMGVFGGRVSMCYIHSASPPSRTSGQQLEHCEKAERDTEIYLGQRGNGISSLIQNSYRWTALLPRSSAEKPNGLVTLQNRSSNSHWDRGKHYSTGDTQKASLCVAAAALSTFAMPCRPVFDKDLYHKIRTGAHKITNQPASCPRSGVNNCSFDEVCKLMDDPPEWRNRESPLMWIAGQMVGDGPEVMSVDSGYSHV